MKQKQYTFWTKAFLLVSCGVLLSACSLGTDVAALHKRVQKENDQNRTYTITKGVIQNGSLNISEQSAKKDAEITVIGIPVNKSYVELAKTDLTIVDGKNAPIAVDLTTVRGGFTFKMPDKNITIHAIFGRAPDAPEPYKIYIKDTPGGEVVADRTEADSGDKITVTITANTNYEYVNGSLKIEVSVDGVTFNNAGFTLPATSITNFDFDMPDSDVYISAEFEWNGPGLAPDPGDTEYTIVPATGLTGGTLTSNKEKAKAGDTVILTATPLSGYKYSANSIRITGVNGSIAVLNTSIQVGAIGNSTTFTFTMPLKNIFPTVLFTPEGSSPGNVGPMVLYSGIAGGGVFNGIQWVLWGSEDMTQPLSGGMGVIGGADGPPAFTSGVAHDGHAEAIWLGPEWAPYGGGIGIMMYDEYYFTDDNYINLNAVDALQLWVRSGGGPITISYVGFGADVFTYGDKYSVRYAGENNTGIEVTDTWQKIVVPVPKRVNAKVSQAFMLYVADASATLNGKVLYLDDIEFIETTVAINAIIPQTREIPFGSPTPLTTFVTGLKVEYLVGGADTVSLYNSRVDFSSFHTVSYSATGGAIVGVNFNPSVGASSAYTFSVKMDDKTGTMMGSTAAQDYVVMESMLNKGRVLNSWDLEYDPDNYLFTLGYTVAGGWYAAFGDFTDPDTHVSYDVLTLMNKAFDPPGGLYGNLNREEMSLNIQGATTLATRIYAYQAGSTVTFTLTAGNAHVWTTPALTQGWNTINAPFSEFSGDAFGNTLTKWSIRHTGGTSPYDPGVVVNITEVKLMKEN